MFFWRRKRQEVEAEAVVQPDFHYWYYGCRRAPEWRDYWTREKYQFCFELCYDEEVGDDDFARICTEILIELFSPYWTSMWVRDSGHNHGFILPNGEPLGRKEDFFAAFSRCSGEEEVPVPGLLEKMRSLKNPRTNIKSSGDFLIYVYAVDHCSALFCACSSFRIV